jgi:hypothetical protein
VLSSTSARLEPRLNLNEADMVTSSARNILPIHPACDLSRASLSGVAGGQFAGDILVELHDRVYRIEVKARRQFRALYAWLAHADLLLLKADRQPPLAVLSVSLLAQLVTSGARP